MTRRPLLLAGLLLLAAARGRPEPVSRRRSEPLPTRRCGIAECWFRRNTSPNARAAIGRSSARCSSPCWRRSRRNSALRSPPMPHGLSRLSTMRFMPTDNCSRAVPCCTSRHAAAAPTVLSLAPWGLAGSRDVAVRRVIATGDAGHRRRREPAGTRAAVWRPAGRRGRCGARLNEWGASRFELSLAAAPLSRLVVDVPSGFDVSADRGLLAPPPPTDESPPRRGTSAAVCSAGSCNWVAKRDVR